MYRRPAFSRVQTVSKSARVSTMARVRRAASRASSASQKAANAASTLVEGARPLTDERGDQGQGDADQREKEASHAALSYTSLWRLTTDDLTD